MELCAQLLRNNSIIKLNSELSQQTLTFWPDGARGVQGLEFNPYEILHLSGFG